MRYLEVACRLLLVAVFVIAVLTKVSGREAWVSFVRSLHQLRLLPSALVRPAALATVLVEVIVAILLLVPVRGAAVAGFVLAGGLLLVFTAAIAVAVVRGERAPCRCFGASRTPLGPPHIARNLALCGVAALGLAGVWGAGRIDGPYALLAGSTGLVAGLLVATMEDIVALLKPIR